MPVLVRPPLRRCLERDPRKRLRDIGDFEMLLSAAPASEAQPRRSGWLAAGATAAVALALAVIPWRGTQPLPHPPMRFSVDLGPQAVADAGTGSDIAISPDGTRLAYLARAGPGAHAQVATRLLDQAEPTLLPGAEGGAPLFFSPDGEWIGFFFQNKMKKISVHGGPVTTLCDAPAPRGAAWGPGFIVASLTLGGGLSRVPDERRYAQGHHQPRRHG